MSQNRSQNRTSDTNQTLGMNLTSDTNQTSDIADRQLQTYGTHGNGSPDQLETRHTARPQSVEAPDEPATGSHGTY